MNQIKELFTKAKAWVKKTYDVDSPMNKFDWILIGVATGVALTVIKSAIVSCGVVAILAHHAYKRS
ncbi:hypothetical protein vBEclMUFV01_260 [Enterobacter phage vB_EclM-UFV01]|nr:hypothetical protein vBEclMUFV01_260 [Enterobacter phage vB_EclM-UFV01]